MYWLSGSDAPLPNIPEQPKSRRHLTIAAALFYSTNVSAYFSSSSRSTGALGMRRRLVIVAAQ